MHDDDKRLAAEAALDEIAPGMRVGIGTGSTMAFAIHAIGARLAEWPGTSFYATSQATWRAANAAGIPIARFADIADLDIAIDGADEIDPQLRAIKGAGGAMLREKVIASAARRMVVVADGSKRVAKLGKAPVPVEVLPFARSFVEAQVVALGAEPALRMNPGRAYRTNQGNLILDCRFGPIAEPAALARALDAIPGLLGHGLFLDEVDAAYVAADGIVTKMERAAG